MDDVIVKFVIAKKLINKTKERAVVGCLQRYFAYFLKHARPKELRRFSDALTALYQRSTFILDKWRNVAILSD